MDISSSNVAKVISHRGASGEAPENTLAAIRKAAELGARWVEFDVMLTRDNHAILIHDEDLARTTTGVGRVADTDWIDLKRLDAGSWFGPEFAGEPIPTLLETIGLLAELGLGANVEIKPSKGREEETAHIAAAILLEEWPRNLPVPLISSFSRDSLATALVIASDIPRVLLIPRIRPDWRNWAEMFECTAIHTNERHLRPSQVDEIHSHGYAVRCYTVNEATRAETLFAWGVDGVFSDYPDRIPAK